VARKKSQPGRWEKTSVPGIYRRNGSYVVRVYNAGKGRNGGRDDYPASSFEEAKEIKRGKEQIRKRTGSGVIYTVREWMGDPKAGVDGRWFELFPRPRESTALHNRERVKAFVAEHGDLLLSKVTPEQALEFSQGFPARVVVVRAAFNDAVKARQIEENPFAAVDVRRSEGRRNITVLTDEEIRKLIATAGLVHGDFGREVFGPMIAVAAGTGVRPGESFAILRDDLDLEAGSLHVWRQWNGRLRRFASVKGTRLDRTVEMHDLAWGTLRGMELPERGVIWRTVREAQFTQRSLTYYWPPVRAAFVATLPESHHLQRRAREEIPGGPLDFYELRHKFGTELAKAGCSEYEIMDQMGHSDAKTVRTYVHLANSDVRLSVRDKLRRAA
jgi:integrase